MKHNFLGLIVFIMMFIIFFNETYNISKFLISYNTIKDIATINKETCDNYYTEAETERYQLSKNSYNLLLKNDIFNSKTYTVFILIIFIIFYLYSLQYYIKNTKENGIISLVIIISTFITILLYILVRYVPTDEAGYSNLFFNTKDGKALPFTINVLLFILIGTVSLAILFNFKNNNESFKKSILILYFTMSFYLLINTINIVMTFKNNEKIYGIDGSELKTADVSYDSENNYYFKYNGLGEYPSISYIPAFSNYTHIFENNYSYEINQMFIRNLKQFFLVFAIIIGICIIIIMGNYFYESSGINIMLIDLIFPIIYIFILIFFVCNFIELNTTINYHLIYLKNGYYKKDLSILNDCVTPYIKILDKKIASANNDGERDYTRNYIILNVLMSYLCNYINIIDNSTTGSKIIIDNFKNINYEANKKLEGINHNNINNAFEFDEYYNQIFNNLNFPNDDTIKVYIDNMFNTYFTNDDIINNFINTLSDYETIYYNDIVEKEKDYSQNIIDNAKALLKGNINDAGAKEKLNLIRKSIKNNIYFLFNFIDAFKDDNELVTEKIKTLSIYPNLYNINSDNTKDIYKFIVSANNTVDNYCCPPYITNTESIIKKYADEAYTDAIKIADAEKIASALIIKNNADTFKFVNIDCGTGTTINKYCKTEYMLDKLINKFLIIIKELLRLKKSTATNTYKSSLFKNILSVNNEKATMTGNSGVIIYYLKNIVLEYKDYFESDNYLINSIKNNYYKINKEINNIEEVNSTTTADPASTTTTVDKFVVNIKKIENDNATPPDYTELIQNSFIVSQAINIAMFYIVYVMIKL